MKHISEDKLLQYALEIDTGDVNQPEIIKHLETCSECRERFMTVQKDIGLISGVKGPRSNLLKPPVGRNKIPAYSLLKAAALLIFGFLTGFGVSNLVHREPIRILPSYTELSPPADSLTSIVVSDATQIDRDYYEQMLIEQ